MKRKLLRQIFRLIFWLLARIEIHGIEHIPQNGACLLTFNHLGMVDAPLLYSSVQRQDFTGLVADKHQKNFFLNWVVNTLEGIWIDRDRADFQALKQARRFLKKGGLLAISPEGTRSPEHSLIEAKSGVAFLAERTQACILPAAITGTENGLKAMFTFKRPLFKLHIGESFRLPPIDRKDRDGSLKRNTDEIMCRIAALLPVEYRGVYADHPRLGQLLQQEMPH